MGRCIPGAVDSIAVRLPEVSRASCTRTVNLPDQVYVRAPIATADRLAEYWQPSAVCLGQAVADG
jgi:hypothetical protein